MATSHAFQNDVCARRKNIREAGNRSDRASKVTSMIELFNVEKKERSAKAGIVNSPSTQRTTRIASSLEGEAKHRKQNDVFVKVDDVTKPVTRRLSPISVGLRVPKPYVSEIDTGEEKVAAKQASQVVMEAAAQERQKTDQSRSSAQGIVSAVLGRKLAAQSIKKEDFESEKETRQGGGKNSYKAEVEDKSPSEMSKKLENGGVFVEARSGRNSPKNFSANGSPGATDVESKVSKSDERRISNARNYWEHKIEPTKGLSKRGLSARKSDPISGHDVPSLKVGPNFSKPNNFTFDAPEKKKFANSGQNSPKSSERAKNSSPVSLRKQQNSSDSTGQAFAKSSDMLTFNSPKLRPKSDIFRSTLKPFVPDKPVVPTRPRGMSSAAGSRPKPSPQEDTILSSLHGSQTVAKSIAANFTRSASPLRPATTSPQKKVGNKPENGSFSPPRPKTTPQPRQKPNAGDNGAAVNPLPKPERTFTFSGVDSLQPLVVKQKPRHRNVARVSSDLTTINGPGISGNLSKMLGGSTPDISTRAPKEGYEEVTLFETKGERSQTMHQQTNTQKWQKQHNYEEVEDTLPANEKSVTNYDRIDLSPSSPRSLTLDDSNDSYSHLMFKQDLHMTQTQKPLSLINAPHLHHMKLKKQNSDMTDTVSRNSDESLTKSEKSLESGLLQITDKIRETFTQISRKYRHHRKAADDNEDTKSMSSSGDEDSDTETDFNKHRQTLDRVRTYQKTYRNRLKYKSMERELSKFEESTLFEQVLICKIVVEQDGTTSSKVSYRFPRPDPGKNIGDEKMLSHFCFPDIDAIEPRRDMQSHSYSFMLTREDGTRKFGYCRRILPPGGGPRYPVVYCLISPLGSFGLYELILDALEPRYQVGLKQVSALLEALFVERFPAPGRSVTVELFEADCVSRFVLRRPYDTRLEHVDLQCVLSELGIENTIKIFASLLLERRVIICGKSLSILTACIYALRALLYPFVWQHVFVPVLPPPMVDLCCSPTPLLIGILETSLEKLKTLPLEEVFIFNLSTQEVISCMGDELEILPMKLQTPLINSLGNFSSGGRGSASGPSYDFAIDYVSAERNTIISESFMHLFVEMIGHYEHHFQPVMQATNAQPSRFGRVYRNFNRTSFYDDVMSRSLRRFLDLFMGTQMFDGFVHSRELASPDYQGLFERRIAYHLRNADASQLNFKVIKTKMKKIMLGIGKKK